MKKFCVLLLPLAALVIACNSNKGSDASVKTPKSVNVDSFYSADRAFADVRGNAKQCVVVTTNMEPSGDTLRLADEAMTTTLTQNFDRNGHVTEVTQTDMFMDQPVGSSTFIFEFDSIGSLVSSGTDFGGRFIVKRNADGFVTAFTSIGSNGDVDYTKVYTWKDKQLKSQQMANEHHPVDADGNPIIQPIDKVNYTYDEKGYRISDVEESGDPQLEINVTETTYIYNDFDEHGNWTSRDVNRLAKLYKIATSSKRTLTDSVATFQNEKRVITYY